MFCYVFELQREQSREAHGCPEEDIRSAQARAHAVWTCMGLPDRVLCRSTWVTSYVVAMKHVASGVKLSSEMALLIVWGHGACCVLDSQKCKVSSKQLKECSCHYNMLAPIHLSSRITWEQGSCL